MERTVSEGIFEQFCTAKGIAFDRIDETDQKTPDYYLKCGAVRIVAEVKETSPNAEERESNRVLEQTGVGLAVGGTPGARVRSMIKRCSPQLKARSEGVHPSLLVVFDEGRICGHVEPYHIRVAMYGLEQVLLA